jgi:hypothetical protein
MTMQYDVESYHNTVSGVAVPYRTRLKGVVISPSTSTTYNVAIANNVAQSGTYDIPGTTTCTITIAGHGVATGSRVWVQFTSVNGISDVYLVTAVTQNTFTITTGTLTTSGNVTVYNQILTELDCSTGTSFYTLIPGEGILALDGIYVGLPTANTVTSTIFYG